jgi:hypothetical protein
MREMGNVIHARQRHARMLRLHPLAVCVQFLRQFTDALLAGARLGIGARHTEQVAKLNEEELRVGALGRARGGPARNEVLDFPARHEGLLHEATGRRQC